MAHIRFVPARWGAGRALLLVALASSGVFAAGYIAGHGNRDGRKNMPGWLRLMGSGGNRSLFFGGAKGHDYVLEVKRNPQTGSVLGITLAQLKKKTRKSFSFFFSYSRHSTVGAPSVTLGEASLNRISAWTDDGIRGRLTQKAVTTKSLNGHPEVVFYVWFHGKWRRAIGHVRHRRVRIAGEVLRYSVARGGFVAARGETHAVPSKGP